MTAIVTLYTRAGCHLCEEAEATLARVLGDTPFDLERVDVETDDALLKRYLERIPVVAVDGVEVFEYVVDPDALRRKLTRR